MTQEGPKTFTKRTGRRVYGVAVHYRYGLQAAKARRGRTRYKLPARRADRTKIVVLPRGAKSIQMTNSPPIGPKLVVA